MERLDSVLIVEDDQDVARAARVTLTPLVEQVHTIAAPHELKVHLADRQLDVVLLDMNFGAGARSGREGLSALSRIRAADRYLSVVLMTAFGGVAPTRAL